MLSQVGAEASEEASQPDVHGLAHHQISLKLTLKVGHVSPDLRVQGIDHHLPVDRAGNLQSSVLKTRSRRWTPPCVVLTDVLGVGKEVEGGALVELGLADLATLEQSLAAGIEGAVEDGEEDGGFLAQDLLALRVEAAEDVDILEDLGLDDRSGNHVCESG